MKTKYLYSTRSTGSGSPIENNKPYNELNNPECKHTIKDWVLYVSMNLWDAFFRNVYTDVYKIIQ